MPGTLKEIEHRRFGPFITQRLLRRADGTKVVYSAWRHRHGHGLIDADAASGPVQWWAPQQRDWWIALLFMIGSACFFLGAFPLSAQVLGTAAAPVFFIGSIFFTSAGYLQYFEASNEGDDLEGSGRTHRWFGVRARSIGWWATAVQFIGTLNFNVSTFFGLAYLSTAQEDRLVWAPDAFGSVCFLLASALVVMETQNGFGRGSRSLESRIAWINMIGSIAFGFSAVAALVLPSTGELLNVAVANTGTWIGGVCFFVGALLLIPAMRPGSAVVTSPRQGDQA